VQLSDLSIRRPVLATVVTVALVVFGLIGYSRMPVREVPDVDFPVVSVATVLRGANPEVVETEVTEVLEEEISSIDGIRTITSRSTDQVSRVTIEFDLDRDIDVAAQDVRDKVARVRDDLPEDAEEPRVTKLDIDARAIMWIALTAPGRSLAELTEYADTVIKERLQTLPGVGSVIIGGERRPAVRIALDRTRLEARRLTVTDVVRALRDENVELPSGRIESATREFVVKTEGNFPSAEAFNDLIVDYRDDRPVRIRDVGTAAPGVENDRTLARFNGVPTAGLGILKQSDANTVSVADHVGAEVERLQGELPPGHQLRIAYDGSRFIRASVAEVRQTLIVAAILVTFVIFLFLRNVRSTMIPAITMPVATVATFAVMYALDFTVNTLTLLALTLAVGVLVDDAIIVLENIYRHLEGGESRPQAAHRGADEIAFAAIATTLALVAVFVPVAFLQGVTGRFFYEFGITVAVATCFSTFVALTLTPMLCSRYLRAATPGSHGRRLQRLLERAEAPLQALATRYGRAIRWALAHRWGIVGAAVTGVGVLVLLVMAVGKDFLPQDDRGSFVIIVESPEGSTLAYHDRYQRQVEGILNETREIRSYFSVVALSSGGPGAVNRGMMFVRMLDRDERTRSQREVMQDLRRLLARVPGVRSFILTFNAISRGSGGKSLAFQLQNPDFEQLRTYAPQIMERVKAIPGLRDVDTDLELEKPQLDVTIHREKAAALGISAREIATTLQILLAGQDVSRFRQGNERYDVIVRLAAEHRAKPTDLGAIAVRTRAGELVPLSIILSVRETVGPNALNHYNRRRSVLIDASLEGVTLGEAIAHVRRIAKEILPPGFAVALAGESREFEAGAGNLSMAFLLGLLMVYLVLAGQFESFVHPLTIMLAVPLGMLGGVGALWALGMTLNVYSVIGLIMLMGLVTKNSILLPHHGRHDPLAADPHDRVLDDLWGVADRVGGRRRLARPPAAGRRCHGRHDRVDGAHVDHRARRVHAARRPGAVAQPPAPAGAGAHAGRSRRRARAAPRRACGLKPIDDTPGRLSSTARSSTRPPSTCLSLRARARRPVVASWQDVTAGYANREPSEAGAGRGLLHVRHEASVAGPSVCRSGGVAPLQGWCLSAGNSARVRSRGRSRTDCHPTAPSSPVRGASSAPRAPAASAAAPTDPP
jgi:multidrug efflux pump